MRSPFALCALLLLCAAPAQANDIAKHYVPNAQQVGTARLSIALWDVYDVTLYAPEGVWDARMPFALSIVYFLAIEGADIAERSVEEMRKQGFSDEAKLAQWHTHMREIFPDVKNGTQLTAVFIPGQKTTFYDGARYIGAVNEAAFGTHFANIWLSEKASEPALRRKLLGLS